jgi:hypothetical protein
MKIRKVTHAMAATALALTVATTATAWFGEDEPKEKDTPGDIDDDEKKD